MITPEPKLIVVSPCSQCVPTPVTLRVEVCVCETTQTPEDGPPQPGITKDSLTVQLLTIGPTLMISAALGVTLNPVPPTISEPVIMVTLFPPTGAVGETEMVAVAVVGLVIV